MTMWDELRFFKSSANDHTNPLWLDRRPRLIEAPGFFAVTVSLAELSGRNEDLAGSGKFERSAVAGHLQYQLVSRQGVLQDAFLHRSFAFEKTRAVFLPGRAVFQNAYFAV